jgi:hypothetical protein
VRRNRATPRAADPPMCSSWRPGNQGPSFPMKGEGVHPVGNPIKESRGECLQDQVLEFEGGTCLAPGSGGIQADALSFSWVTLVRLVDRWVGDIRQWGARSGAPGSSARAPWHLSSGSGHTTGTKMRSQASLTRPHPNRCRCGGRARAHSPRDAGARSGEHPEVLGGSGIRVHWLNAVLRVSSEDPVTPSIVMPGGAGTPGFGLRLQEEGHPSECSRPTATRPDARAECGDSRPWPRVRMTPGHIPSRQTLPPRRDRGQHSHEAGQAKLTFSFSATQLLADALACPSRTR